MPPAAHLLPLRSTGGSGDDKLHFRGAYTGLRQLGDLRGSYARRPGFYMARGAPDARV